MRIIVENNATQKQFEELDVGTVFKFEDEYFIKIYTGEDRCNSLNINDEMETYSDIAANELVYPKKCFLTIED